MHLSSVGPWKSFLFVFGFRSVSPSKSQLWFSLHFSCPVFPEILISVASCLSIVGRKSSDVNSNTLSALFTLSPSGAPYLLELFTMLLVNLLLPSSPCPQHFLFFFLSFCSGSFLLRSLLIEFTIPSSGVSNLLLDLSVEFMSSVHAFFSSGISISLFFRVYSSLLKFYLSSKFLNVLTIIIFRSMFHNCTIWIP